jgi:hypothetical protein
MCAGFRPMEAASVTEAMILDPAVDRSVAHAKISRH